MATCGCIARECAFFMIFLNAFPFRMQRNKGQFTSSKSNHDDSSSAATSWDSNQNWGADGAVPPQQEVWCVICLPCYVNHCDILAYLFGY